MTSERQRRAVQISGNVQNFNLRQMEKCMHQGLDTEMKTLLCKAESGLYRETVLRHHQKRKEDRVQAGPPVMTQNKAVKYLPRGVAISAPIKKEGSQKDHLAAIQGLANHQQHHIHFLPPKELVTKTPEHMQKKPRSPQCCLPVQWPRVRKMAPLTSVVQIWLGCR